MAKQAIVALVFLLMVLLFSACTTQRLANDSLQQRASVNTYRAVTFNDGNITVTVLGSDEINSISQCGSRAIAILRKATSDEAELVLLSLEMNQTQTVVRSDFAQPSGLIVTEESCLGFPSMVLCAAVRDAHWYDDWNDGQGQGPA